MTILMQFQQRGHIQLRAISQIKELQKQREVQEFLKGRQYRKAFDYVKMEGEFVRFIDPNFNTPIKFDLFLIGPVETPQFSGKRVINETNKSTNLNTSNSLVCECSSVAC